MFNQGIVNPQIQKCYSWNDNLNQKKKKKCDKQIGRFF